MSTASVREPEQRHSGPRQSQEEELVSQRSHQENGEAEDSGGGDYGGHGPEETVAAEAKPRRRGRVGGRRGVLQKPASTIADGASRDPSGRQQEGVRGATVHAPLRRP